MHLELKIKSYAVKDEESETICDCGTWVDRGMRACVVADQFGTVQSFTCCSKECIAKEAARLKARAAK